MSQLDEYICKFLDFWRDCHVSDKYIEHKKAMNILLQNQGMCLNYIFMTMTKKPEAMLPVDFDEKITLTEFFEIDDAKRFRAIVLIIAKLIGSTEMSSQFGQITEIVSKKNRRTISE